MSQVEMLPRLSPDYVAGSQWMWAHIDELMAKYPNQWVAVHRDRVIATGPDLGDVSATVRRTAPEYDVVVHFVDDGSLIY